MFVKSEIDEWLQSGYIASNSLPNQIKSRYNYRL